MGPLYDDIQLRTSDVLGDFADTFVLEHRYGDLSKTKFRLGKLGDTLYFAADHPMEILSVQELGQEITGWRSFTKPDKAGITSTYVELSQPAERSDSIITASGLGKRNPDTGGLIENPADIISDVVAINKKILEFPLFHEECERRGIRFAGSLDEVKSLRLYVKNIVSSIGGLWVKDNVIIYPKDIPYAKTVYSYSPVVYKAKFEDRAGSVKVAYNYNEGSGKYASFVVVKAVGSPYTVQRVEYCKWLRDNKTAIELGTRLAAYYAGEFVEVRSEAKGVVHSGDAVQLEGSFFDYPFIVTEAAPEKQSTAIVGDLIINLWPKVVLDNYTAELPITQREGLELEFDNGVLTITIYDLDNKPFIGAFVSLDKSAPKKTNSRGKVTFKTTPGQHVLDIAAPGFDSISNLLIQVQ